MRRRTRQAQAPCADACAHEVELALAEGTRELARTANRWARQACAEGRGDEVPARLDTWAARSGAPLVRIGRRLHPAHQLRFR